MKWSRTSKTVACVGRLFETMQPGNIEHCKHEQNLSNRMIVMMIHINSYYRAGPTQNIFL